MSLFHAVVGGSGGGGPVLTGNAVEGDVLAGKTFYNTDASIKKTGAMANKKGQLTTVSALTPGATNNDEYTSFMMPENGCFDTSSEMKISTDELKRINDALAKGNCSYLYHLTNYNEVSGHNFIFWDSKTPMNTEIYTIVASGNTDKHETPIATIEGTGSGWSLRLTFKKKCYGLVVTSNSKNIVEYSNGDSFIVSPGGNVAPGVIISLE